MFNFRTHCRCCFLFPLCFCACCFQLLPLPSQPNVYDVRGGHWGSNAEGQKIGGDF